jgi:hypothetical protein
MQVAIERVRSGYRVVSFPVLAASVQAYALAYSHDAVWAWVSTLSLDEITDELVAAGVANADDAVGLWAQLGADVFSARRA